MLAAGSNAIGRARSQQQQQQQQQKKEAGGSNNRLSNYSSMRLSGKSTPNPVRRNTTRGSVRQLSVDPNAMRNNSCILNHLQQHSSAPQTPLVAEHNPMQKSPSNDAKMALTNGNKDSSASPR